MMKNTVTSFVSLCMIVIVFPLEPVALAARHKQNQQKLMGRVIAKDAYLGLARLSSAASVEVFIVRVDQVRWKETSPRFIKVRYEDYEAKGLLASGLLDGKMMWRFSLRREKKCDQIVSEGLLIPPNNSPTPPRAGAYILLENAGSDLPKVQSLLPCFIVQPGGIRPMGSTSAKRKTKNVSRVPG